MGDDPAGEAPHAAQHGAVGHPRRGEHHVAAREVVEIVDAVQVGDAHALRARLLVVVAEVKLALHLAADRAQRRRREDALGRAADAHVDVDAAVRSRRGDHAGDVAVADQADAGAGLAHRRDQLLMARPIEDQHHEVADVDVLGPGQVLQVLRGARLEVHQAVRQTAADCDLVHVGVGRVEETALAGDRQAGDRVGAAGRGDRGALQRVERDVDSGAVARADPLADVQHRRLVPLALADHHGAVDAQHVQRLTHGVDRRLIRRALVAAAHPGRARDRRTLGHAHRFQRQVAVLESIAFHAQCLPNMPPPNKVRAQSASILIRRGGSSTVGRAAMRASAPVICASRVSCVVRTIGTGSCGLRARWIRDSIDTS